jgi:hypothetical protein
MRLGGDNQFDTSELELADVDDLDGALNVAVEVLGEYGVEPDGHTRIERLARFVAFNLGDDVRVVTAGLVSLAKFEWEAEDDWGGQPMPCLGVVERVGSKIGVRRTALPLTSNGARKLAAALIRIAHIVDNDGD